MARSRPDHERSRASAHVEELNAGGESPTTTTGDGGVVEYDPARRGDSGELTVQSAEPTPGTIVPDQALLDARDELIDRLGGTTAFATAYQEAATPDVLGLENIQGIGVGFRSSRGAYTGELAVKVFVAEKAPLSRVAAEAVVPAEIGGYLIDVEQTGEFGIQVFKARYPRPVPCGVSCGHFKITAGTIGCLVVLNNNRLCILSNNHVLANENNAQQGDAIIQPGRVDGGHDPADRIGILERFIPLQFPGPNLVDCAAAWTSYALVKPQHVTYRLNPSPLAPSLSLSVMKNGRTTQATQGVIIGLAVNNVRVTYGAGTGVFNNQIIIRGIGVNPFSAGGDSGSLIVSTQSRQAVGLLFAGSSTHTIANPIASVISALGISRLVGG